MSLKKKLSIIIPAVCAVVAIVLCVFLYREWTRPKMIEAPFERLYWGMTLQEAEQILEEVGIEKVLKESVNESIMVDVEIWTLTIEQAELLGYKPIADLELSAIKNWPLHVGFESANKGGVMRLTTVSMVVEVNASDSITSLDKIEHVRKQISKDFGNPINERRSCWCITDDPDPLMSPAPALIMVDQFDVGARECVLEYRAHKYVMSLYGGQYGWIESKRYM